MSISLVLGVAAAAVAVSVTALISRHVVIGHSSDKAAHSQEPHSDDAASRLNFTIRPQFRTSNKLVHVRAASGDVIYSFVRHRPAARLRNAVLYSMLDASKNPVCTIYLAGIKSHILFHHAPTPDGEENYNSLNLLTISHVVSEGMTYRMFIMPDGATYQWTGDYNLERVIYQSSPPGTSMEEYKRIAKASNIGTRVWKIGYDSNTDLDAAVIFSTALVSILDQWSTPLGVGGIYLKSDKTLSVRFKS